MRYLHTMLRVRDLDAALHFYCNLLGLKESHRRDDPKGRYTLVFLMAPGDADLVEVAHEIAQFNSKMVNDGLTYLLIGLGRWGTLDPWLGIPVFK